MNAKTLGYRSDLIFPRYDGEILDRGDYLVIRTPLNPGFYWGNYLLFPHAPKTGDLARWKGLFAQEIGTPPRYNHLTFGWDEEGRGEVEAFLEDGFNLNESVVLATGTVNEPPKRNNEVVIRPLRETWEWAAATEMQVFTREPQHEEAGYRKYREQQMLRYRKMTAAGLGAWFGAFLGETIVADLGVYKGDDLARFQSVTTHPDYRRRGICGTLVYEASQYALRKFGVDTLVMQADEHYHAARIYESVGFKPAERLVNIEKW